MYICVGSCCGYSMVARTPVAGYIHFTFLETGPLVCEYDW